MVAMADKICADLFCDVKMADVRRFVSSVSTDCEHGMIIVSTVPVNFVHELCTV